MQRTRDRKEITVYNRLEDVSVPESAVREGDGMGKGGPPPTRQVSGGHCMSEDFILDAEESHQCILNKGVSLS